MARGALRGGVFTLALGLAGLAAAEPPAPAEPPKRGAGPLPRLVAPPGVTETEPTPRPVAAPGVAEALAAPARPAPTVEAARLPEAPGAVLRRVGIGGGGAPPSLYTARLAVQVARQLPPTPTGQATKAAAVRVVLTADGQVASAEVLEASGDAAWDAEVVRVLAGAGVDSPALPVPTDEKLRQAVLGPGVVFRIVPLPAAAPAAAPQERRP